MLGTLNNLQIDTFLRSELIGRIGCSSEGKTYVVPIAYAYDGQYIYSHTEEGQKINMLRQNPSVCFEVDKVVDLANWQSVVLQGKFEELSGEEEEEALYLLRERMMPFKSGESNLPKFGMDKLHTQRNASIKLVAYRIQILERSGRFEKG